MERTASGTFEIKRTAEPSSTDPLAAQIARFALDKAFQGDLVGTSCGQMLAFVSAVPGSAGYVALEVVLASLHGQSGSFALQHVGTMRKGDPSLRVSVVPDSGTDALTGICGTMEIQIVDGEHRYRLVYDLPPVAAG